MPLAAPVTIATLFSSSILRSNAYWNFLVEVIVNDLAETERKVGDDLGGRDNFTHRQIRDRRQRMRMKIERARSRPSAFKSDIFQIIFDQFANSRRAVDVRYDLQ
jgi:hypothetical protein